MHLRHLTARIVVTCLMAMSAADCAVRCPDDSVSRGGECVRACNATAECLRTESCVDGICEDTGPRQTTGSSSSLVADMSSSADVPSSSLALSSSQMSVASSSSAAPSSSGASSSDMNSSSQQSSSGPMIVAVSSSTSMPSSSAAIRGDGGVSTSSSSMTTTSSSTDGGTTSSSADGGATKALIDDFEDGALEADWNYWRFQWSETMGQLRAISAARPGFNYGHSGNGRGALVATHIGDTAWTNYRVELDVESTGVGGFNPYAVASCYRGFSVLFRVENLVESWNAPANTSYGINVDTRDCSNWSTRGRWGLTRAHDSYIPGTGWSATQSGSVVALVDGTSNTVIDGPNHVVIEVNGNRIRVFINDALVVDHVDMTPLTVEQRPITYGGIGVSFGWESVGWIDNVVVMPIP